MDNTIIICGNPVGRKPRSLGMLTSSFKRALSNPKSAILIPNILNFFADEDLFNLYDAIEAHPDAFVEVGESTRKAKRVRLDTKPDDVFGMIDTATTNQYWFLRWKKRLKKDSMLTRVTIESATFKGFVLAMSKLWHKRKGKNNTLNYYN